MASAARSHHLQRRMNSAKIVMLIAGATAVFFVRARAGREASRLVHREVSACTVDADSIRPLKTASGDFLHVDPQAISSGRKGVLVAGRPVVVRHGARLEVAHR